MQNSISDSLDITGDFYLKVYENGVLIESYEDKNVIVVVGRGQLARLLSGATSGRYITNIGFGEGTSAASPTDTALTSQLSKAVGAVTYPTGTSVNFDWTLENAEGNGKAITEFGLLTGDGTLFSRKQRSVINKTSSIRLIGSWTINL